MMRSLYSGVAGLKNHQTRMDVIGNNIANVNTAGFKAGRTTFQDMLSQSVKGAASPTANIGGVNPLQVGLGMSVASVDNIFTGGSMQSTGKNTDLAISGDGFFVVNNGLQKYYTRAGNFDFDAQGNYVIPGTGLHVMGWNAVDGVIQKGDPVPLQIPLGAAMPAKPTTKIILGGNLNSAADHTALNPPDPEATKPTSKIVFDSEGNAHEAKINFTKTGNNVWLAEFTVDGAPEKYYGGIFFTADGKIDLTQSWFPATDTNFPPPAGTMGSATFTFSTGVNPMVITPDFSGITQYGIVNDATAKEQDGYTAGTLDRATLSVDSSGIIFGKFSNGQLMNLGQVAMAIFTNPAGLTKVGTSLFSQSNNSGDARVGEPGSGGYGAIMPSNLEMSNVDLSEEFTTMITTQRGFQANSRIITTSDTLLEELINLKR